MMQDIKNVLKHHRAEIDSLDDEIVSLLALRLGVIDRVAKIKAEKGIQPRLADRVVEVISRNSQMAEILGADVDLVKSLYSQIVENAIERETIYIDNNKS